jgi:hypothetical protein
VHWRSTPQGAVTTLWLPLQPPFGQSRPAPL